MRFLSLVGLVAVSLILRRSVRADWKDEREVEYRQFVVNLPACDRVVVIRIGQPADGPGPEKGKPKSADLPQGPDSAGKLYHVQPYDEWWMIDAQKAVTGIDAERLAGLYRALKMRPIEIRDLPDLIPEDEEPAGRRRARAITTTTGPNCHSPPFAYRFYAGGKLLYDTSICWGCQNIIVGPDGNRRYLYFQPIEKEALSLFDLSNKLFPDHPAARPREKEAAPRGVGGDARGGGAPLRERKPTWKEGQ